MSPLIYALLAFLAIGAAGGVETWPISAFILGILAHSALPTKQVGKVDKCPRAAQCKTPWTRQSSFSDWASAYSSV